MQREGAKQHTAIPPVPSLTLQKLNGARMGFLEGCE
jgi:hypothetical protein